MFTDFVVLSLDKAHIQLEGSGVIHRSNLKHGDVKTCKLITNEK